MEPKLKIKVPPNYRPRALKSSATVEEWAAEQLRLRAAWEEFVDGLAKSGRLPSLAAAKAELAAIVTRSRVRRALVEAAP